MAKLFTKHDPFNVHKVLGFLCLFHFIYRFAYFVLHGNMGFESNSVWVVLACLGCHAALSGTSLVFRLPSKRIKTERPMIWPEFRAHNILFAYRPILAIVLTKVLDVTGYRAYAPYATSSLIFLTLVGSQWISDFFASTDKTMRGMPYPHGTEEERKRQIKRFHAVAQFNATMSTFVGMDFAFATIMPVQVSAFLMTLVRKGLISSRDWHNLYAFTLVLPYIMLAPVLAHNIALMPYFSITTIGARVRIDYNINKYVVWGVVMCLCWTYRFFVNPDRFEGDESLYYVSRVIMFFYGIHIFRDVHRLVRNLASMPMDSDNAEESDEATPVKKDRAHSSLENRRSHASAKAWRGALSR